MTLVVFIAPRLRLRRRRADRRCCDRARWVTAVGLVGPARRRRGARDRSRRDRGPRRTGRSRRATYLRLFLILGSMRRAGAGARRRRRPGLAVTRRRSRSAILAASALTLGLADPRRGGPGRRRPAACSGPGHAARPATAGPGRRSGSARRGPSSWPGRWRSPRPPGSGATSASSPAQPVVFGLAYLAFALAVAMRFGAIPFHPWAARLTDAVPETACRW